MRDTNLGLTGAHCFVGSRPGEVWHWVAWSGVAYEIFWESIQAYAQTGRLILIGEKFDFLVQQPSGPDYRGKAFIDKCALDRYLTENGWDCDFHFVATGGIAVSTTRLPRAA